ncbi:hypothetical protein M569_11113, partial [Genlisea aurea]
SSSCISIIITLTCMCIIATSMPIPRRPTGEAPFPTVYAFGDSYTDTGNTRSDSGPAGFTFVSNLPYGRTYFHRPTNRYSDGRLVIDFVAEALSIPFLRPYRRGGGAGTGGVNFAVAGATAIDHRFFAKNNMTLDVTPESLATQLGWFRERKRAADALFWVGEIGANDYAYSFGSSFYPRGIRRLAINTLTKFLQALLEGGAKYVVVQGLPPTGCLTLSLYLAPANDRDWAGCVASGNKHSQDHNAALKAKLNYFRQKFPKATIVYADYYEAYLDVIRNPAAHGIKELFKSCCGNGGGSYNFNYFSVCGSPSSTACRNPSEYVNWDGVHLTEGMYRAVAESFLNGTHTQPPWPQLLDKKR